MAMDPTEQNIIYRYQKDSHWVPASSKLKVKEFKKNSITLNSEALV